MAPIIEICVDNFESVVASAIAGADRIELCSSLLDGGLTPSHGFLKYIKQAYPNLDVFVMIRPRGGDFCYSPGEIQIMANDIEILKEAGADGFVFGCLRPNGSVDMESNKPLMDLASPFPCTFHRAFDMVKDATQSMEDIVDLGFSRILTSGQHKSALEGVDMIAKLVKQAHDRIIIMPGAGITSDNLEVILRTTQAKEFHSSASAIRHSQMNYRNPNINMGSNSSEFTWKESIVEKIQDLIKISSRF